MMVNRSLATIAILALIAPALGQDASLTAGDITLSAGEGGVVVVSGEVNNVPTFGVSILVNLVPRENSVGVVAFTPAPPIDVRQLGDPWKGLGQFSRFDTNTIPFSTTLNGSVDANGIFLCDKPLTYSGPLTGFPFIASGNANGVWDVRLSADLGESSWECVPTVLRDGTITVSTTVPAVSAWGLIVFSLCLAVAGSVFIRRVRRT